MRAGRVLRLSALFVFISTNYIHIISISRREKEMVTNVMQQRDMYYSLLQVLFYSIISRKEKAQIYLLISITGSRTQ